MSMLAGLGRGLQGFSSLLGEHQKMNRAEQQRQVEWERTQHLEELRHRRGMEMQKSTQEHASGLAAEDRTERAERAKVEDERADRLFEFTQEGRELDNTYRNETLAQQERRLAAEAAERAADRKDTNEYRQTMLNYQKGRDEVTDTNVDREYEFRVASAEQQKVIQSQQWKAQVKQWEKEDQQFFATEKDREANRELQQAQFGFMVGKYLDERDAPPEQIKMVRHVQAMVKNKEITVEVGNALLGVKSEGQPTWEDKTKAAELLLSIPEVTKENMHTVNSLQSIVDPAAPPWVEGDKVQGFWGSKTGAVQSKGQPQGVQFENSADERNFALALKNVSKEEQEKDLAQLNPAVRSRVEKFMVEGESGPHPSAERGSMLGGLGSKPTSSVQSLEEIKADLITKQGDAGGGKFRVPVTAEAKKIREAQITAAAQQDIQGPLQEWLEKQRARLGKEPLPVTIKSETSRLMREALKKYK